MEKSNPYEITQAKVEQIGLRALNDVTARFLQLGKKGLEPLKKNEFGDVTLRADWECEEAVIESVRETGMPVKMISEEHGEFTIGEDSQYLMVLDGLDGTAEYKAHSKTGRFGTMFAIMKGKDPTYSDVIFAGITEPNKKRVYYATPAGSFVIENGIRRLLTTSGHAMLDRKAVIYIDENFEVNKKTFSRRLRSFNRRMHESSAVHYVDVANGKADAALECTRKKNLELATAYLLVKNAGGAMIDLEGTDLGNKKYLAFGQEKDEHIPVITTATPELAEAIRLLVSLQNKDKLLISGIFRQEDVSVAISSKRFQPPPELQQQIENVWKQNATKGFFSGPLVSVENYMLTGDGKMRLTLGHTNYKDYLGTRDINTFRKYGYEGVANPLVTSTVIMTGDNKLLVAKRAINVDQAGRIDAVGGHIDVDRDQDEYGKIDIFKAAKREVFEETRLEESEISEIVCLGLSYQYNNTSDVAASFVIRTPLTANEITSRDTREITLIDLSLEKDDERYLADFIQDNYPNVEPEAIVTIALARRYIKGVDIPQKEFRKKEEI